MGKSRSKKSNETQNSKKKAFAQLASLKKSSPFPKKISPELATLVDEPPLGNEWLHEIKLDGYRLMAYKEKGKTLLRTRRHHDWTNSFLKVAKAIDDLPIQNIILDGEVVVLDENERSNFQLLQNSIKSNEESAFVFYVFDLLYYDQYNLMSLPLIERKDILTNLLPKNHSILHFCDHVIGNGKQVFKQSCQLKLEGIISKKINSPYQQKRTQDWLKIKCIQRQEFVIGGFTQPQGNRKGFGALLLGSYDKKHQLIYHGNVGTGFSEKSLASLHQALIKLKCETMPFTKRPPGSSKVTWVKPILVAEIEFTEWTTEGALRHPSFKGLRNDKSAKAVTKERVLPMTNIQPTVSHPDKILYPEGKITKQEVADYYEEIHAWILPYIINRPLTIVRCPEGYQHCFYQKHINKTTPPALLGVLIKEKESKEECIYIKDKKGLMALPQMGVLEIHPWGSQIKELEHPDIITFDLDPGPGVSWKKIVETAFEFKKQLASIQLTSFVKTTGGKGLHVVIPIKSHYDWSEIKEFAHLFVDFMMAQHPKDYINKMTKAKRKGKIFLDYFRNQRGATAIAPYSTRARKGAPVATPLDWDELTNDRRDTFYTIKTLPRRLEMLKKDPWADFFKLKQSLKIKG